MKGAVLVMAKLQAAGFRLEPGNGDRIVVTPPASARLTDELRAAIRAERRGILMMLALQTADAELTALRERSRRTA